MSTDPASAPESAPPEDAAVPGPVDDDSTDRARGGRVLVRREVPAATRRRLLVLLWLVCVLGYAADQVTKWLALANLSGSEVVPLVDGWLGLRLLFNPGAAFSLGEGTTWLFTAVAVVVVVVIVRVSRRLGSRRWAIALGLLLSGALGNLTDRLLREPGFGRGHVIDFIAYRDWFVGNVADVWIVGAAAAIALLGVVGISPDGSREVARPKRPRHSDTDGTDETGEPHENEDTHA